MIRQLAVFFDPQRSADNTSPVILPALHPASLMHKTCQGCRIRRRDVLHALFLEKLGKNGEKKYRAMFVY